MSLNLSLLISIVINIILILIINKKKLKYFFYKSELDEIEITKLHNIFQLRDITENLKGPLEVWKNYFSMEKIEITFS